MLCPSFWSPLLALDPLRLQLVGLWAKGDLTLGTSPICHNLGRSHKVWAGHKLDGVDRGPTIYPALTQLSLGHSGLVTLMPYEYFWVWGSFFYILYGLGPQVTNPQGTQWDRHWLPEPAELGWGSEELDLGCPFPVPHLVPTQSLSFP